jgi:hypothetical protein
MLRHIRAAFTTSFVTVVTQQAAKKKQRETFEVRGSSLATTLGDRDESCHDDR